MIRAPICNSGPLSFEAPDFQRFPALRLAYEALAEGGSAPTILNAANEIAVAAFLHGEIRFLDVIDIIEATLQMLPVTKLGGMEDVLAADAQARLCARRAIDRGVGRAA